MLWVFIELWDSSNTLCFVGSTFIISIVFTGGVLHWNITAKLDSSSICMKACYYNDDD